MKMEMLSINSKNQVIVLQIIWKNMDINNKNLHLILNNYIKNDYLYTFLFYYLII
jgi:hypothetical protein